MTIVNRDEKAVRPNIRAHQKCSCNECTDVGAQWGAAKSRTLIYLALRLNTWNAENNAQARQETLEPSFTTAKHVIKRLYGPNHGKRTAENKYFL